MTESTALATRRIVSITRTVHDRTYTIHAEEDDGTVWKPLVLHKNGEIEWTRLPE